LGVPIPKPTHSTDFRRVVPRTTTIPTEFQHLSEGVFNPFIYFAPFLELFLIHRAIFKVMGFMLLHFGFLFA
jgi:hypothetical protein